MLRVQVVNSETVSITMHSPTCARHKPKVSEQPASPSQEAETPPVQQQSGSLQKATSSRFDADIINLEMENLMWAGPAAPVANESLRASATGSLEPK